MTTATTVTVYRRNRRRLKGNGLAFAVILPVLALTTGAWVAIGLAAVGLPLIAYHLRRPRLRANADGITVANTVRTTHIAWRDVEGFGYGEAGKHWCVLVRRRDGTSVPVRALDDDLENSHVWVQGVVADLRARLTAATGTTDHGGRPLALDGETFDLESLPTPDVSDDRLKRSRRRVRVLFAEGALLALFLVGLGASTAWDAATTRPHAYQRLRSHGVRLTARFAGCGHVDRFDKNSGDDVCRLTLSYLGQTRKWDYQDDYPQFDRLAVGSPVPVLLDPARPTTVYTVHDVETNDNAGIFSVLTFFGLGMIAMGLAFFAFLVRTGRRDGRRTAAIQRRFDDAHRRAHPLRRRRVKAG